MVHPSQLDRIIGNKGIRGIVHSLEVLSVLELDHNKLECVTHRSTRTSSPSDNVELIQILKLYN